MMMVNAGVKLASTSCRIALFSAVPCG